MALPSTAWVNIKNMSKQRAASLLRLECTNPADIEKRKHFNVFLDDLLNPSMCIEDLETIDWCMSIMAGGLTTEQFAEKVKSYDSTTKCGLVWTPNFVAYRCRTCGISPCMSLCTECFKKGNHDQHDFNMFLSQAGGACDCGDTSVLKESGFCDRHGLKANENKSSVPSDLMDSSEIMMPRIILRLIHHLREKSRRIPDVRQAIEQADPFLEMLLELNGMGTLMRRVITGALTDPEKYQALMNPPKSENPSEYDSYCQLSNGFYLDAIKALPNPEPPDEYKECASLQEHLEHTTFLEELVFWTVAYEFPQQLVCLLLNMLPDVSYKEALIRAFVLHYSRISMMLERSLDPEPLSNRVVHVSVQLFSNQQLALRMVDELKLLHVMVISLKYMMTKILIQNTLHDQDKNFHYVVDCGRNVMKEHCYWPLVSDLNNVLSHKPVAERFMSDDTLLEMWFEFISTFQGMNVNQKELNQHVEFEPNTYYAAFSAELEASAYPMWALVSHLRGPESIELSRRVLNVCLSALQDWLDAVNYTELNVSDSLQVSFHLPLHRYFAVFMSQAIRQQGQSLNDLLPPIDMLHLLMMHPLRVQVAFYEILHNMWSRNGLQIKGQAMTYVQCNFCNSMVDADLYLLQICATKIPADVFLKTVIEKFNIKDWMRIGASPVSQSEYMDSEHDIQMLESCLIFLAILVSIRTNLGLSDYEMSHLEMVTLLCIGDKTHSQLMELMPEHCGSTQNRDMESVLSEVAQYRAPNLEASGNMQQGMYGPKRYVWEKLYDPLYALLRAVHRRDFQTSMDRYSSFVKNSGHLKSSATPWPPFRHPAPVYREYEDPRIVLNSKIFHATSFIILYKAVNGHNISEHTMALAIYLLEMAVICATTPDKSKNPLCEYDLDEKSRVVDDSDLDSWYESNNISENLRTIISEVEPSASDSISGEIQWEISEIEDTPMISESVTENPVTVVPHMSIVPENEAVDTDLNVTIARTVPSMTDPPSRNAVMNANESIFSNTPYRLFPPILRVADIIASTSNSNRIISRRNPQSNPTQPDPVIVGESIISLLLKLHSQLSGTPDSFNTDQMLTNETESSLDPVCDSRIGDGPFFVAKLLNRIANLGISCKENIKRTRNKLWPQMQESEDEQREKEERERQEKKKLVRERQQKLMTEFRNRQQQFAEANFTRLESLSDVEADMEWDSKTNEYLCVICNQKTPSTDDKPIGLIVLIQETSVVGHERQEVEGLELPVSDENSANCIKDGRRSDHFDKRFKELNLHFNTPSAILSVNIGLEGGVRVQACGHHLHVDCLSSYLQSLPIRQRPQSVLGDRTEYLCPVCRQQANSILPLTPHSGMYHADRRPRRFDREMIVEEVNDCLKIRQQTCETSNLVDSMKKAMKDVMYCADVTDEIKFYHPSEESIFLLVNSVARTNLEIELVQFKGSLWDLSFNEASFKLNRHCMIALFHVLAPNVKNLTHDYVQVKWQKLAGLLAPKFDLLPNHRYRCDVPILLQDPIALFLQFFLLTLSDMDQAYFSTIVKVVFNLLYYQVLVQISYELLPAERNAIILCRTHGDASNPPSSEEILRNVINNFRETELYSDDNTTTASPGTARVRMDEIENKIQTLCLPFLRIAALVRFYLYGKPFDNKPPYVGEFGKLVYYLELAGLNWKCLNSAVALNWPNEDAAVAAPKFWCDQFIEFVTFNGKAARNLVVQHIPWQTPKLLRLPREYEKIFTYYHKRQCQQCNSVPKQSSICLLCGTIVCLRDNCCKQWGICEAVQHSIDCGAGTAMFLAVTSTYVIVIRGNKACSWGSLHLDYFAEEDKDLKRGKPLYLSQERYQLLEQQWLAHKFDHTNKNWVAHKDAL